MKHSKLPWRKVVFPDGGSFIQANRNKRTDPYDIEVFGDDTNPTLYPQVQKDADIDLTLRFVNNSKEIVSLLEEVVPQVSVEFKDKLNQLLLKLKK